MEIYDEILTAKAATGDSKIVDTEGVEQLNVYYETTSAPVSLKVKVMGSPDDGITWVELLAEVTISAAEVKELLSFSKAIRKVKVVVSSWTSGAISCWINARRSY